MVILNLKDKRAKIWVFLGKLKTSETRNSNVMKGGWHVKFNDIAVTNYEINFKEVNAEYEGKYPPNMYSEYLPKDPLDWNTYVRKKARW